MSYKSEAKDAAAKRVDRVRRACGGSDAHPMTEASETWPRARKRGGRTEADAPVTQDFSGGAAKRRLDRAGYKRGGKAKGTQVNVIVAPGGGAQHPEAPVGAAPGPVPAPVPAHPPMPMPPMAAGARPPVAAPMPGVPLRKRGGRTYEGGAGSGRGRLEKAAKYGAKT